MVRACIASLWLVWLCAGVAAAQPVPTAHPLLWRIAGPTPSYLYGTIHVPDERVLALPAVVVQALDTSRVFCSEVRMDADSQARAAAGALLPAGQTLDEVLPPALYGRAERYLAARDLDIAVFARMKVWSLASVLSLLDQLEPMARRPGLDALLQQRAAAAGKRLDALEKVGDQLALLDSLGREGELAMLRQSLDHLESVPPGQPGPVEQMIRVYLEGDTDVLMAVAFEYADFDDPLTAEFMDALIDRRNLGMAAGIERRIAANAGTGYFFAVGALHLPGPEGILALLAKRGLDVERVRPGLP